MWHGRGEPSPVQTCRQCAQPKGSAALAVCARGAVRSGREGNWRITRRVPTELMPSAHCASALDRT
jgi:hypothetical protein